MTHMNYSWESKVKKAIKRLGDDILPKGFELVGLAVVNTQLGEASLVENPNYEPEVGVCESDLRNDILGDAKHQHKQSLAWYYALDPKGQAAIKGLLGIQTSEDT